MKIDVEDLNDIQDYACTAIAYPSLEAYHADGCWFVGDSSSDGEKGPTLKVVASEHAGECAEIAKYYSLVNPSAVLKIISTIKELEKEKAVLMKSIEVIHRLNQRAEG